MSKLSSEVSSKGDLSRVGSAGLAGIHYPKNESKGRRKNSGRAWYSVFMNLHEKITFKNISSGCLEEQLKYKEYIPPQ